MRTKSKNIEEQRRDETQPITVGEVLEGFPKKRRRNRTQTREQAFLSLDFTDPNQQQFRFSREQAEPHHWSHQLVD